MTGRSDTTSSRETAARAIVTRMNPKRRSLGSAPPVYVSDDVNIPKRKRRVLLDLAPETVESLRAAISEWARPSDMCDPIERLLVTALEQVR